MVAAGAGAGVAEDSGGGRPAAAAGDKDAQPNKRSLCIIAD